MKKILTLLSACVFCFAGEELVLEAANSFVTTMRANHDAPVRSFIQKARATIVFPSVKKVGFVVGGMGGDGVMIVGPLESPSQILPVQISGGSVGLQIGYDDSSLVLFIMKDSVINEIKNSKLAIDSDASVSFGDRGLKFNKLSDVTFSNDIYAYTQNSGFFAGASFGGAVIKVKNENLKQDGYAYEQLLGVASKF